MSSAQNSQIPNDAPGWYARHRRGELSSVEAEAFARWVAEDENRTAFERLGATWQALDGIGDHPAIARLRKKSRIECQDRHVWVTSRPAVAALLALFAVVSLAGLGWLRFEHHAGERTYRSAIGERSTIELSDGSVVILDTDSIVQVQIEQGLRSVKLVQGRAYFHVAKDPKRPFVVRAKAMAVTALGTQFDVGLRPDQTEVVLTEGRIRIEPKGLFKSNLPVVLSPGQQLVAAAGEQWKVKPIDSAIALSWLKGKLVFSSATIGTISEELNRYSRQKIIVDPSVAQGSMSAVLDATDTETFVRSVEAMGLASAEISPDGTIRLEPLPKKN